MKAFAKKLGKIEAELKKYVAYEKSMYFIRKTFSEILLVVGQNIFYLLLLPATNTD